MNILKKLQSIFFGKPKEETKERPITIGTNRCYWCEEPFEQGEFQKKFNRRFFHRRCYKAMLKQAKKNLGIATS